MISFYIVTALVILLGSWLAGSIVGGYMAGRQSLDCCLLAELWWLIMVLLLAPNGS